MGDIYLHSDLPAATAHLSVRSRVHLVSIVSAMSRAGTWPHLAHTAVIDRIIKGGNEGGDDRPPESVLAELIDGGFFTHVAGVVTIGPRLDGLVSNTEPLDYLDNDS